VVRSSAASDVYKRQPSKTPKSPGFRPIRPQDEVSENDRQERAYSLLRL
jgi:hypothetical protein